MRFLSNVSVGLSDHICTLYNPPWLPEPARNSIFILQLPGSNLCSFSSPQLPSFLPNYTVWVTSLLNIPANLASSDLSQAHVLLIHVPLSYLESSPSLAPFSPLDNQLWSCKLGLLYEIFSNCYSFHWFYPPWDSISFSTLDYRLQHAITDNPVQGQVCLTNPPRKGSFGVTCFGMSRNSM